MPRTMLVKVVTKAVRTPTPSQSMSTLQRCPPLSLPQDVGDISTHSFSLPLYLVVGDLALDSYHLPALALAILLALKQSPQTLPPCPQGAPACCTGPLTISLLALPRGVSFPLLWTNSSCTYSPVLPRSWGGLQVQSQPRPACSFLL